MVRESLLSFTSVSFFYQPLSFLSSPSFLFLFFFLFLFPSPPDCLVDYLLVRVGCWLLSPRRIIMFLLLYISPSFFFFFFFFFFFLFGALFSSPQPTLPYSFNYPLKAIGHGVYTAFTASTAQSEEDINGAGTDLVFFRGSETHQKWKRRNREKKKKKITFCSNIFLRFGKVIVDHIRRRRLVDGGGHGLLPLLVSSSWFFFLSKTPFLRRKRTKKIPFRSRRESWRFA